MTRKLKQVLKKLLLPEFRESLVLKRAQFERFNHNLKLYRSILFADNTLQGLKQRYSTWQKHKIEFDRGDQNVTFHPKYREQRWVKRYQDLEEAVEKAPKIIGKPRYWIPNKGPIWAKKVGIVDVENVWCSNKGRVFNTDGQALVPLWNRRDFQLKHQLKNYLWGVSVMNRGDTKYQSIKLDKVVSLAQSTDSLYGHFLVEVIPRLSIAKNFSLVGKKVYVTTRFQQYIEAVLAMGIDAKDIISSSKYPLLYARALEVPVFHLSGRFRYPDFGVKALKALKQSMLKVGSRLAGDRIFISRKQQHYTRIVEEQLSDTLEKYGFLTIIPENLSLANQISTFHKASVVLGVHGSGMFNIVFCKPGTKIVELLPASTNNLVFNLSWAFGLDYYAVRTNKGNPVKWSMRNCFEVDLASLEQALQKLTD